MKINNILQIVASVALMASAGFAWAGKQGISFYGGLGLGAVAPQQDTPLEFDPAATGNIFIGMEEDGWALEYNGLRSVETGTSVASTDYTLSGGIASLGYRTLEFRSGLYFLISFGKANIDIDFSNATAPSSTDGNVYTLGLGFRTDRTGRMELNYSFYSSSGVTSTDVDLGDTHMVTLRYIWGGTPYEHQL